MSDEFAQHPGFNWSGFFSTFGVEGLVLLKSDTGFSILNRAKTKAVLIITLPLIPRLCAEKLIPN